MEVLICIPGNGQDTRRRRPSLKSVVRELVDLSLDRSVIGRLRDSSCASITIVFYGNGSDAGTICSGPLISPISLGATARTESGYMPGGGNRGWWKCQLGAPWSNLQLTEFVS